MGNAKIFVIIFVVFTVTHDVRSEENCGVNQEFSVCGNVCESDCFYGDLKMCTLECGDPKCVCKKGFYRSVSGSCVTYQECTQSLPDIKYCTSKAGENAIISPVADCPSSSCGRSPKKNCANLPGCICKTGFVLNKSRHCVEPSKC